MKVWTGLWLYRGFVAEQVWRDIRARYRNSILGIFWVFLHPMVMILVYVTVFSQLMQSRLPGSESSLAYAIHLCVGILAWNLFSEVTSRCASTFLDNATVIKKVPFPKACLPVIVTSVGLVNFALGMVAFLAFLAVTGTLPGLQALLAILPLVLLVMMAVGLGTALGVLNVFFRDVGQALAIGLQVLFWLTPIVYPSTILPGWVRSVLAYNPLVPLMESLQAIFVRGQPPDARPLIFPALVALLALYLAARAYQRHAKHMVDEL